MSHFRFELPVAFHTAGVRPCGHHKPMGAYHSSGPYDRPAPAHAASAPPQAQQPAHLAHYASFGRAERLPSSAAVLLDSLAALHGPRAPPAAVAAATAAAEQPHAPVQA